MTSEQECFWNEVKKIQDLVVNVTLSKMSKYDDAEKLLNDVTYETIYGIMELLDGHKTVDEIIEEYEEDFQKNYHYCKLLKIG